jgi:ubiquinone/menaquinone biosynthesis C-methylase UbiE
VNFGDAGESGANVVRFYDTHPINEEQILGTLESRGIALTGLSEETLKDHDQDHFGGIEANDILAAKAGIAAQHRVLDVCSGLGGPARYLASRIGCRVVGLDLNESRHHAARRLTQLVRLDHLVSFQLGNALQMPFSAASFDVVIGQEAWCHIPDKPKLIGECIRMLKRGGVIAFTDILRREALAPGEEARLSEEMAFSDLGTYDGYISLLQTEGCIVECCDDLSGLWTDILVKRLAMYRSLRTQTERKFGPEHFRRWDATYSFFVGLFGEGKLGGGRFVARLKAAGT